MAVRVDVGEHVCTHYRVGHLWIVDTETTNEFALPFQVRGRDHDSLFDKVNKKNYSYKLRDGTSTSYEQIDEDEKKTRTLCSVTPFTFVVGVICHIEFTQFNDAEDEIYGRVYVQMSGDCFVRAVEMKLLETYQTKAAGQHTYMAVRSLETGSSNDYRLYSVHITMFASLG